MIAHQKQADYLPTGVVDDALEARDGPALVVMDDVLAIVAPGPSHGRWSHRS
jgi:hypothetical protein